MVHTSMPWGGHWIEQINRFEPSRCCIGNMPTGWTTTWRCFFAALI
jgi:hypothetical protein